jgi:hypothetical protein
MATCRISGVWTGENNAITFYAIHVVTGTESTGNTSVTLAKKTSKLDAIRLVETVGNAVTTMVWNAAKRKWLTGEVVHVAGNSNNKYLRSNPDNSLTDNLGHLPDFSLIY